MHYVLSDIHGNLQAFESILEQIELKSSDMLYVLGDVSDRHPHGLEILRQIMGMSNARMLLGNHEFLMMDALGFPYDSDSENTEESHSDRLALWYFNGGGVTHKAWNALSKSEQSDIVDYLRALPLNINVDVNGRKFKLVHGTTTEIYDACKDLLFDVNHRLTTRAYFCVWDRETVFTLAGRQDYTTIFGHTPVSEIPRILHESKLLNRNRKHDSDRTTGPLSKFLSRLQRFRQAISSSTERPRVPEMEIFHDRNIIGIDCGSGWPEGSTPKGHLACLRLEDMREFYSD